MNPLISQANSEYINNGYENIIHKIDEIYFPLKLSDKKIGVALSGGADSAILTFIICYLITEKNLTTDVHIITNVRNWKNKPWQEYYSEKVFEYFENRFNNIKFTRHVNFVPPEFEWGSIGANMIDEYGNRQSGDIIELRAFSEYVVHHNNIDSWYVGVNKNPELISDNGGMKNRNLSTISIDKIIIERENVTVYRPFFYLEKDSIMSLYDYFNLKDLLEITRSCEGEIEGIDYKTYKKGQIVPICGECFWCRERAWGIEQKIRL